MRARQLACVVTAVATVLALAGCSGTTEPATAHPQPTEREAADPPVVFLLGDSYTSGHRAGMRYRTYGAFTARKLGWQVVVGGFSGTGFVNDGHIKMTFAELFEAQFSWRPEPDMIIVSGGHNDYWHDQRRVGEATLTLLHQIQRRFSHTRIVVIGPIWAGDPPAQVLTTRDVIRKAAERAKVPFIDPLAEKWFTGSPANGTGNVTKYILPDRTHPTRKGHKYLARRLTADLRALELAEPTPREQPWKPPAPQDPDAAPTSSGRDHGKPSGQDSDKGNGDELVGSGIPSSPAKGTPVAQQPHG